MTTDADYESIEGAWIFEETVSESGDKLTLNVVVTKDTKGKYQIVVGGMSYVDETNVTTSQVLDAAAQEPKYTTTGRTVQFTSSLDEISDLNSKAVVIGEDGDGVYITIAGVNNGLKMRDGDSLYQTAGDPDTSVVGTVSLKYVASHKEHSWTAMENAFGLKTINDSSTAKHYKSCECGLEFIEENCAKKADGTELDATGTGAVCYLCGYDKTSGAWLDLKIWDGTTAAEAETYFVKKDSVVSLPYGEYPRFNASAIEITGWSNLGNTVETEAGKVKVTTAASVLACRKNV